jgi:tripartite-type tricarboxylate transporter receptor subunit TctC
MKLEMSRTIALVLGSILAMGSIVSMSTPSLAQSYPTRPIRLIVPQAPGGQSDVIGRIVAERLSEILRQPVFVENRGGIGGTIGAEAAAKSPADGYTLLLAGSNNLGLATILIKDLRYTVRDFAPVGAIARVSYALAVRPAIPATTIAELVAHARAHPGELNYGSSGVGSASSLGFELLKRAANVDIVHIPYKGSAIAVSELVSGRIDMVFADLALLAPLANDGSLRLIAVAGTGRSSAAPDVRTVAEQAYPELAVEPWYGIVVPAGTPAAIVEKLSVTLVQTLRTPAVRQRFDRLGYSPIETNPEQLAELIRTEIKTFEALVGQIGIEAQR